MPLAKRDVYQLNKWYSSKVKPFLSENGHERVEEFDKDLKRILARADDLCKPLAACVVGGSGVGKSTLINCLVGRHEVIVPSGGVGPLTAQALKIEYGACPGLRAIYHPPTTIWKLIFALERIYARELATSQTIELTDLTAGIDEETIEDVEELQAKDDPEKRKRADQYLKQARLLVTGQQESDAAIEYVVDTLREVIGKERIWGTAIRDEDKPRVERMRKIFETDEIKAESIFEIEREQRDAEFDRELKDHATGFLAPAIKTLDVSWNSDLLQRGLELVDLPGVGIAGDLHRTVTDAWMRGNANVVILVVDHRGVRESDAELLRASGFLSRLLHSADDPTADPVSFLIAVVKADEIADSRRADDKSKSKREHLVDVKQSCRDVVRSQIRERLEEAWSSSGLQLTQTKRDIVERLVTGLNIHPISSTQFRKLVANDDDDLPFIREEQESGVPQLRSGLAELADEHRKECHERFNEAVALYEERLTSTLQLMRAKWEEGARAKEEVEELQKQLREFLQPLLKEFHARQGQFRSFLKEVLPANIETVLTQSRQTSSKAIRSYLRSLKDAHWATLKAAVRRGGTFDGARHIDLPRDFAQTFEEPIAEAWSQQILKQIRQRTKEFANDCMDLVQQIVFWAREQGSRVQPKLIEAQQEAIQSDSKQLATVGREMVNELRDRVRQDLVKAIEGPIRRRCQAFVKRNDHIGSGVKVRILDLFDEIADEGIESATGPAQKVLLDNYRIVEEQIREVFKAHQNPLESAESAILASHHDHLKRSDGQKRRGMLRQIDEILEERPGYRRDGALEPEVAQV